MWETCLAERSSREETPADGEFVWIQVLWEWMPWCWAEPWVDPFPAVLSARGGALREESFSWRNFKQQCSDVRENIFERRSHHLESPPRLNKPLSDNVGAWCIGGSGSYYTAQGMKTVCWKLYAFTSSQTNVHFWQWGHSQLTQGFTLCLHWERRTAVLSSCQDRLSDFGCHSNLSCSWQTTDTATEFLCWCHLNLFNLMKYTQWRHHSTYTVYSIPLWTLNLLSADCIKPEEPKKALWCVCAMKLFCSNICFIWRAELWAELLFCCRG